MLLSSPDSCHILTTSNFHLRISVWSLVTKSVLYICYPKPGVDFAFISTDHRLREHTPCSVGVVYPHLPSVRPAGAAAARGGRPLGPRPQQAGRLHARRQAVCVVARRLREHQRPAQLWSCRRVSGVAPRGDCHCPCGQLSVHCLLFTRCVSMVYM